MKESTGHITSGIALFLSLACAVHCMAMPFLIMALPLLGDSFLHNPILEWGLLATLIILGQFSMQHYRKKHHNSSLPGRVFAAGVIICFAALVLSEYHMWVTMAGSVVIAVSHGINLKLSRAVL